MATKTWSRTVGDANWSTGANWNGGTVPVTTDTATFDGTSVLDCTIDALAGWGGPIVIAATYSGIITQSVAVSATTYSIAGGTYTISASFDCTTISVTGGIFDASSQASIVTRAMTFSGGTIRTPTTTWTVNNGSWTQSGSPTFTDNGCTFSFASSTAATFTMPSFTVTKVTFNKTNVNFTVASGTTCPLGTSPSCSCGTGTFTVNGVVTWTDTLTLSSPINVSSTGTLTVSGTIRLSVNGSLTFDPSATITASLPLSIVGTIAATITATAYTFATSTISRGSGTLTIAASTTLPLGANPTTASSVFTINGTVTVSGTWTHSQPTAGGVEIVVGATGTVSGALTTLILSSAGLTLNATATWPSNVRLEFIDDITADLTATAHTFATSLVNKSSGGFTLAAGTAITLENGSTATTTNINGTLTLPNGATYTASAGDFNVSATGTVTTSGAATFATDTGVTINASATISGAISVLVTANTATARTIALGGKTYANFTRSGSGSGTRTITGTNTFTGTFQDNEGSVAHTIVFPNVTTTVGDFIVAGSSGKLVTLSRTGGAGTFTLTKTGGGRIDDCDYLSISNSTVDASPEWYAGANSTDGTGNTNWIFTAPPALGGPRKSIVLM